MYAYLVAFVQSPIAHGALVGAIAAANVDIQAFRNWKSFHDLATYSWTTAIFRWAQGAVLGALTVAGIVGLS